MELTSIDEREGRLTIFVSQYVLYRRFLYTTVWFAGVLVWFALAWWMGRPASLLQIYMGARYLLLFPVAGVIGVTHCAISLRKGEKFVFDKQLDAILHNRRRVAKLSALQHIKVNYSSYAWLTWRHNPVKDPLNIFYATSPNVWLIVGEHEVVNLNVLSHAAVLNGLGPPKQSLKRQMQEEAIAIATRISEYTGVGIQQEERPLYPFTARWS